jgi:methyltransferase (TIGR00027 family)
MAVQRALESLQPPATRLFEDPYATVFVSRRWRLALALARVGLVRRTLQRLYDRAGGPGPRASAIARTRLIDDALAEAVAKVEQVVILGAGFDSRAHRLAALDRCAVFEVDHPATQALKRRRLADVRDRATRAVTYVAVDFERDDLLGGLRAAGYHPQAPGVFVWEGVTNYLTAEAVDVTLAAIRALASAGSTLLFTYVDRAVLEPGRGGFPEAARWLDAVSRRGEPWTFGLAPAALEEFLAARGFSLVSDTSTAEAGEAHFPRASRRERGSALYRVVGASIR